MRKILRPFTNAITLGPSSVPRGPLRIDWTHPLSRGMIFACVPGSGVVDITGTSKINSVIPTTDSYIETIEGPSYQTATITSTTPTSTLPGATSGSTTSFSFYWRGLAAGTSPNSAYIFGSWRSDGTVVFVITAGQSGWGVAPQVWWRSANTDFHFAMTNNPTASGLPKIISLGATYGVNGTVTAYANGIANGTQVFGGAVGPTVNGTQGCSFASPDVTTGNLVGYVWNRILDPYEMAWIDRDPYRPLMSAKPEMSILQAQAGPATIFRRTASRIGTRTGSRQTWAA